MNQQNDDLAALAAEVRETRELVEQMHGALEAVATALLGALTPVGPGRRADETRRMGLALAVRAGRVPPRSADAAGPRLDRRAAPAGRNRDAFIRRVLAD